MSYLVLARKWRPQTFDEVIGQEHVVLTLKNAIANSRIAHAYLFTGSRGIGKTTVARILAKAINCADGPTPVPCNRCSTCTEITSGRYLDVMEIDGASNRGIDEVRELRENVKYTPSEGNYKIYIIDEVHMLTDAAFNALLKTLEEPPEHVIFIFATTEPHKIPLTILSRCQRFDFRSLSLDDISTKMKEITASESIELEEGAIFLIARKAQGSMRDALSYLDQVVSYSGSRIMVKDVVEILGIIDEKIYFRLSEIIRAGESKELFPLLNRIVKDGYQLHDLIIGLTEHYHRLLSFRIDSQCPLGEYLPGHLRTLYIEEAAHYEVGDLSRILEILSTAEPSIKRSDQARVLVELTLIKMTYLPRTVEISRILEKLESSPGSAGGVNKTATEAAANDKRGQGEANEGNAADDDHSNIRTVKEKKAAPHSDSNSAKASFENEAGDAAQQQSVSLIIEQWQVLVQRIKNRKISLGSFLSESTPVKKQNNTLVLQFEKYHKFHKEEVQKRDNLEIIREECLKLFGFLPVLEFRQLSTMNQKLRRITHQDSLKNDGKIQKIIKDEPVIQKVIDILDCEIMK
jgi:DNA polymerase-3 subunit gamma/tau